MAIDTEQHGASNGVPAPEPPSLKRTKTGKMPKAFTLDDLKAIDPRLAERVELAYLKPETDNIDPVALRELASAKRYLARATPITRAGGDLNRDQRAWGKVARKWVTERKMTDKALAYIDELAAAIGAVVETPSKPAARNAVTNPQTANEREVSPLWNVERGEYVCPECDKGYAEAKGVGIHRRHVHGVLGQGILDALDRQEHGQFVCDQCTAKFFSEKSLKAHKGNLHSTKTREVRV